MDNRTTDLQTAVIQRGKQTRNFQINKCPIAFEAGGAGEAEGERI
ncbi:hypothetical protein [Trichormus variabilis]|nr:hypothetical protein [Trichormus variabilis]